jgi:hypothetical protein
MHRRRRTAGKCNAGDRACELLLIADRPVDISGGNCNRLPLRFGNDRAPVGRIEFASFAMLAMRGHRSDTGAYATRPGEVADLRVCAPPGAQFVARTRF